MSMHESSINEIVKSVSIDNLVRQRDGVLQRIRAALDLLVEAQALARAARVGFPDLMLRTGHSEPVRVLGMPEDRSATEEAVRKVVDAIGWQNLMSESGLRTFMDADTRRKWDEQVHRHDVPALTSDNVRATFMALHDHRGAMFDAGVINCFRRLSWDYKSNLPQKFGKRIVLERLHSLYGAGMHACDTLDDLIRVFSVLDGRPEPDHRDGMFYAVGRAIREQGSWPRCVDTQYIALRIFKNGNGHATFKRPDLVEAMNRIVARHFPGALPPAR